MPADRLIERVRSPHDLKALSGDELDALAAEIRDFLVEKVARTGGHLGPNLGVVELTLAAAPGLRLAARPDPLRHRAPGVRAQAGHRPAGRLRPAHAARRPVRLPEPGRESEHDVIENSHASTALSYADGLAKAYALRGENRYVVAVVGDGALTGGMCWEALNNIASHRPTRW